MIIGCDLIRSLGIDIHGTDMTIHWEDAAIPWRDIDSTTNNVFALYQYNAPFNSETKIMKRIVFCGIHVAPRDGGIAPVNCYVSAMYVNAKGSD